MTSGPSTARGRGLLQCPIVGVAADNWTDDELRAHARAAIEACGETIDEATFARLAGRLSYLAGNFAEPATFERVAAALDGKGARSSTSRFRRRCSGWWSAASRAPG